jgi:hypothetical protein
MEPKEGNGTVQVVENYGGQGRNRTADASLFRAALYQLSYLATDANALVMNAAAAEL